VVGGETYKVVLTLHGFRPKKVSAGGRIEMLEGGQRATLCLDRPQNATVNWTVSFDR
jgi:hypothetical protein